MRASLMAAFTISSGIKLLFPVYITPFLGVVEVDGIFRFVGVDVLGDFLQSGLGVLDPMGVSGASCSVLYRTPTISI